MVEDVDGNRYPRLHGRDRGVVHRVRASQGRRRGQGRGRPVPPHLRLRFLLRGDGRAVRAPGRLAPGTSKKRVFLTNSGTEAVEGAIKLARYATRRTAIIAFRGAFHGRSTGRREPHQQQGPPARRLRSAAAGRAPHPVRLPLPLPMVRRQAGVHARLPRRAGAGSLRATPRPARRRGHLRRADPGRRRIRRSARRVAPRPARHLRQVRDPAGGRRGAVAASAGRERCGPATTRGSSPTSSSPPRGSAPGCRSAR